jgi:hypothetical protein
MGSGRLCVEVVESRLVFELYFLYKSVLYFVGQPGSCGQARNIEVSFGK